MAKFPPRCSIITKLVSYDLALSCAEVTGARFMLDYAKAGAGGGRRFGQ
jgi:hypothetical protein